LDRLELKVRVAALSPEERFGAGSKETSVVVRERVEAARELQKQRFGNDRMINARIPGGEVSNYCELDPSAHAAMREVASRATQMTTRGHDTLLKVARTVADLNNSRCIYKKHIAEAAELCDQKEAIVFLGQSPSCRACGSPVESADKFCRRCGHAT
jgi:magnesium chelatase family protein